MRAVSTVIAAILLLGAASASLRAQDAGKSPEEALAQARKAVSEGTALLRQAGESDGDQGALARKALKLFEQAQKLYEFYVNKAGSSPKIEDEISHMQSLIYWSRKMTPLASEEDSGGEEKKPKSDPEKDLPGGEDQPPPPAPEPEEKKPETADLDSRAAALLAQAEKYEKENPEDFFAISVMYFKVVDQFRNSPSAAKALEKCLEYQRRHLERSAGGKPAPAPPAPRQADPAAYVPPSEPMLIRLNLRHPDPAIRLSNVHALVSAVGKKCIPDLQDLFLAEGDAKVLDAVVGTLAGLKDPSTVKFALKWAKERGAETGSKVIRLAAAVGKAECSRIIMIAVAVNADSVYTSQRPLNRGFVEPYAEKVRDAYGSGIRAEALEGLGRMGDEGVSGLRSCLKARSQVAREAILCLGMLKDHRSSGYISFYLQRNNAMAFRSEAMAALFIIGIEAVPYLIKNLDNPALRIWSAYQLREMTGQQFTASAADRWWAWYNQNRKK